MESWGWEGEYKKAEKPIVRQISLSFLCIYVPIMEGAFESSTRAVPPIAVSLHLQGRNEYLLGCTEAQGEN